MPTNETRQAAAARTGDTDEVKRLREENAELREQLAAAGQSTPAKPHRPDFIAEGTREELERTGKAVDPFTGDRLVGDGKPGSTPRTVSAEEFNKTPAKPAGQK